MSRGIFALVLIWAVSALAAFPLFGRVMPDDWRPDPTKISEVIQVFTIILGVYGVTAIGPWCFALWRRFARLDRRRYPALAPLCLWLTGFALCHVSKVYHSRADAMLFDRDGTKAGDDWIAARTAQIEQGELIAGGAFLCLGAALLAAIVLSILALRRDPENPVATFE